MGSSDGKEVESHVVKQTTLVGLEPPRLTGMSMEDMIAFARKRVEYEAIVSEKNQEPGVQIQIVSYKNSVDTRVLRMMYRAKWIQAESIESITDESIRKCIAERSTRPLDNLNAKDIDAIVKNVSMKIDTVDPASRVWTLVLDYEKALEDSGYQNLLEKCPHIAIEHMVRLARPPALKSSLRDMIRLRRNEGIHKKDFFSFVQLMVEKAIDVDKMEKMMKASGSQEKKADQQEASRKRGNDTVKNNKTKKESTEKSKKSGEEKKFKWTCLLPRCDGNHRIKDCPLATPEEVKKYLDLYFAEKKKTSSAVRAILAQDCLHTSTLFSATFLGGAIRFNILADIGADDNIMPLDLFSMLMEANRELNVVKLTSPIIFTLAVKQHASSKPVQIRCDKKLDLDVCLKIRHGTELLIRKVTWLVCDQSADCAYLGRPLLEKLGLNARVLLEAACDENNGEVDAKDLMSEGKSSEKNSLCSVLRDGLYHGTADIEEDSEDFDRMYIDLGDDPDHVLDSTLKKAVERARKEGMSSEGCLRLGKLLTVDYRDIFRIRLGGSKPACVRPMKMKIRDNARPVRVKTRRYTPEQREFLTKYVDKLVEMGFLKPNPHCKWQCAPLLVGKPNSKAKFRMTIDLRPINAATEKDSWPMPHIDSEIYDLSDAKCFAKLDFVSGYWQLPVHEDSQENCGIVTPNGVYSSTRVLQGLTNATSHFQGTIEPLFSSIRPNLKAWLDDFMLYSSTEGQMIALLEKFFQTCEAHGLYLSAKKCEFFESEVKWCGRIISEKGVRLDPLRLSALQQWDEPKTAGELSEFVHCCRWMATSIPAFTERVEVLNELLENAYKLSNKRTKKAIKNIALHKLSWGSAHSNAFRSIQKSLQSAVQLAHPKQGYSTCIFTDASERFWSAVVTQTEPAQLSLPSVEQQHEPIAFLSGKFKQSEVNWSVYEKEAFAIVSVFRKLDYLLYSSDDTHLFTDHRNLLFVFCPSALEPALGRHVISKVQRWALYLSRFDYTIEHIPGTENVFADILTRWLKGYRVELKELRRICNITRLAGQILPTTASEKFVWPSWKLIKDAQLRHQEECSAYTKDNDGVYRYNNRIYIPRLEYETQLKLLVVSHSGISGHRGVDSTLSILCEEYYWEKMRDDTRQFVKSCIHCLMTRSGSLVPRPLGTALHGMKPNEVVHLDFLYMGGSTSGHKYTLLMKDDLSGYVWLRAFDTADSESAADQLSEWIAAFGCMKWIVTDQGSHFSNKLIRELTEEYRISHHFVTAYSPWSNGTVERVCREVLRACRSLLSEWKLGPQDWPCVLHTIQSILNQSPSKRLGLRDKANPNVYRTPLECFTGITPFRALQRALPLSSFPKAYCVDEEKIRRVLAIEKTQKELEELHKSVAVSNSKQRRLQIQYHNAKTNVKPLNLRQGDFVLVRRPQEKGHKLQFLWTGPRRVAEVKSPSVYVLEDLLTKKRETVHARRIILYRADMDGQEVSDELLEHAEHTQSSYESIEEMHDIRENSGEIQVQIEWEGEPRKTDWTWEPLANVQQDVPGMLAQFLETSGKKTLKNRAKLLRSSN